MSSFYGKGAQISALLLWARPSLPKPLPFRLFTVRTIIEYRLDNAMKRVAQFEKVSFEEFLTDWQDTFGGDAESVHTIYDGIKLPHRATKGSAGYDFYAPVAFRIEPGQTVKIPTGIRAKMDDDYVLMLFPRSGLGFKYRLQLNNTVGIIDSDYYGSSNEGHIFAKITNDSNEDKTVELESGAGFIQGLFVPFGITVDDDCDETRDGGFGSTDKR